MKRILLISVKSDSPAGGIAVWTDHFLNHCKENAVECVLVNTEIIGKRSSTGRRRLGDELIRTYRIIRNLKTQLRTNRFDAVYLNTSCGNYGLFRDLYLGHLVYKNKLPLVTHYHCDIPYWVKRKISVSALGHLSQMSSCNLVLCQNSKNFLLEHYNITSTKIPNFINANLVRTTPKPIKESIRHALFVGNITIYKGVEDIYAIARHRPDIQFTLVGNVNPAISAWEKPDNLTLTGHLSHKQVIQHLDLADVFLFPSHTEGCSIALLEAMARGVPTIASDTGANPEVLSDGCGIVVSAHDTTAFIGAINRLESPSLRHQISLNAIKRIRERYTERNVQMLFELIPTTFSKEAPQ